MVVTKKILAMRFTKTVASLIALLLAPIVSWAACGPNFGVNQI
jgi:hypothetical protein